MADGSTFDAKDAIASLQRLGEAVSDPSIRELVAENTQIMYEDARARVTFGRGVYRAAIREKVFNDDDGTKGVVFVTQGDWERKPGTKWPKLLPVWLEYGTRKMDPRPHLIPAFNAARERLTRAIEALLAKSGTSA